MKFSQLLKNNIFNYSKQDNSRKLIVCGIPVFTKNIDFKTNTRTQSFLGGVVKTIKTGDIYATDTLKQFKIFNLNILTRSIKKNDIKWIFAGVTVKQDNLYNKFKKKYFKYFNNKYDDIYILNANSGEAYLFLTYCLDACIKKYDSKNPLLVATKPYHIELIKMICPEIDFVYIKHFNLFIKSDTVDFKIDNFRFFQAFSHKHFMQVEIDIKNDEKAHYFKSILNEFDLNLEDLNMRKTNEIQTSVDSMLKKVSAINLNLDKFIIIAPEAHSCELLDNKYWIEIVNKYTSEGYDVFANLVGNEVDLSNTNYKSCYLTYSEVYSLAKRAKKIIMLRSGLTELLLQINVPMEVLYTKFRDRILFNSMDVERVKRGFSVKKISCKGKLLIEKTIKTMPKIKKISKNKFMNIIYKDKTNDKYIKKYFILGLLYYKQNLKTYKKQLRIVGLPIWSKQLRTGKERYYILGFMYFQKSSKKTLYRMILKNLNKKYKNIYINFNASGETYLFLSYLNPSLDSVFIATKKYHVDLCKMMHPNIDCIYMPRILQLRGFDDTYEENYKEWAFYNVLPFNHFVRLEQNLRNGLDVHYCKEICRTMGIEYSTRAKLPMIPENAKNSALVKAKRIGLNLNNFIFLCPESQSNEDLDNGFWKNIVDDLYAKGFDVFLNVLNQRPEYGTAKTCFLTFEEAYYIASLSKGIIGLRSGFIEYLTSIKNIPITCYYTGFKDRGLLPALDAHRVIKGFSLKYLPNININNIKEIKKENS